MKREEFPKQILVYNSKEIFYQLKSMIKSSQSPKTLQNLDKQKVPLGLRKEMCERKMNTEVRREREEWEAKASIFLEYESKKESQKGLAMFLKQ